MAERLDNLTVQGHQDVFAAMEVRAITHDGDLLPAYQTYRAMLNAYQGEVWAWAYSSCPRLALRHQRAMPSIIAEALRDVDGLDLTLGQRHAFDDLFVSALNRHEASLANPMLQPNNMDDSFNRELRQKFLIPRRYESPECWALLLAHQDVDETESERAFLAYQNTCAKR